MVQPAERRLVTEAAMMDTQTRAALGVASATRGSISSPVNLDALRNPEDIGPFAARAENLPGAPEWITGNPVVNVEVLRNSTNGIVQRLTWSGGMAFRTAFDSESWRDWVLVPPAPVVSTDRYADVQDGQTLYVIDPQVAGYNFLSYPNGVSQYPADVGGGWTQNEDANLLGGRGICHAGGQGISVLAWDLFDTFTDGDILTRQAFDPVGTGLNSALVARISHDGEGHSGYSVFIGEISGQTRVGFQRLDSGSRTTLQSQAVDVAAGDATWIRFNLTGDLLRARVWVDGEAEPSGWDISVLDDTYTSGRVGFRSGTITYAWDVLSINTRGGMAL